MDYSSTAKKSCKGRILVLKLRLTVCLGFYKRKQEALSAVFKSCPLELEVSVGILLSLP